MAAALELTMNAFRGLRIIQIEEPSAGSLEYRLLEVTKQQHNGPSADDDATASTELDYYSESESSVTSSSSTSRSVHFNLAATITYENTCMCQEDLFDLWYDGLDYKDFKKQTYTLAKQMTGIELRNRAPHSYQRTLTRTYQLCVDQVDELSCGSHILNAGDAKHMQHWAQATPCRLGLDKWALPDLQKERSQRKHALKRVILDLQKNALREQDDMLPLDQRLGETSEQLSRAARLFAREMALSLAEAEASQVTMA